MVDMEATKQQEQGAEMLALHVDSVETLGMNDDGTLSVMLHNRDALPVYEIIEIDELGRYREEGQTLWHRDWDNLIDAANEGAYERHNAGMVF